MKRHRIQRASRRRFISIRWIATGATVGLTVATVLAVWSLGERFARRIMTEELASRAMLEARTLALATVRAGVAGDPARRLQPRLAQMTSQLENLTVAVVLAPDRTVRAHPDTALLGTRYVMPLGLRRFEPPTGVQPRERLYFNDELLVAVAPVMLPSGIDAGEAVVAFRLAWIDEMITAARQEQTVLVTAMLGIGIVAATLLMWYLLRPVKTLRGALERFGRGDLDTPIRMDDRTEFGLLAETMNSMAAGIQRAQRVTVEKERLARELELAREIHGALLPDGELFAGGFVIHGVHRTALEVGGDFYDVFTLPDGRVGIVVADVAGKGLGGCMVTSMLAALLRALRQSTSSPSQLLTSIEDPLCASLSPGTFVTMFYGLLDPVSGRLTCASAGHSPTLVYRASTGEVEWIRLRGIPLGAVRGGALAATVQDRVVDLSPGDMLVQFTDGINEAFEEDSSRQLGFRRLAAVVASLAPKGCHEVITGVESVLERWTAGAPPHDDETLLVVSHERHSTSAAMGSSPPEPEANEHAALEALAGARLAGHPLELPVAVAALPGLRPWIESCPDLCELGSRERTVLESGLYEVCANIIEHGYGNENGGRITIWWVPASRVAHPGVLSRSGPQHAVDDCRGAERIKYGHFVVLDHGRPFCMRTATTSESRSPREQRRHRGLGLEMIRNAMSFVRYHPGTVEGNITVLGFDPAGAAGGKQRFHG